MASAKSASARRASPLVGLPIAFSVRRDRSLPHDNTLGLVSFGILPFMLGMRLRLLLLPESVALISGHTRAHVSAFFAVVMPLIIASSSWALVSLGVDLGPSIALAVTISVTAAWVGFSFFNGPSPLILPVFYALSFVPGFPIVTCAYALMVGLLVGGGLAWRRLLRHPWRGIDRGTEPSGTRTWRHLTGVLLMGALTFCIARITSNGMPFFSMLIALVATVGLVEHAFNSTSTWLLDRLAGERLRPLSRRDGAAASILSIFTGSLKSALFTISGTLLGLAAAHYSLGMDLGCMDLVLMAPYALITLAAMTALLIALVTIPFSIAIAVGLVIGTVWFLGPFIAYEFWGSTALPILLVIASLLALVLVPVAWYRLAMAELP